jgi:hypothetical protein
MRKSVVVLVLILGVAAAIPARAQQPFREYLPFEGYDAITALPPDYDVPGELVVGRLMYPGGGFNWLRGGTTWTVDYPKGDRTLAQLLRRFTRIHVRSVEQPVNLDDGDDVFYWPWLYAVEVGSWSLTDAQALKLREYLLRGGFLMVDDFHGPDDWQIFMESMKRVFPDRPVQDVLPEDPIFHVLYDIDDLSQIPGAQFLQTGRTWEYGGLTAHWRAIYDDDGRIMVMICHNMDLGDAVEHSDTPEYPENYSARAMRAFINFVIYSMTH